MTSSPKDLSYLIHEALEQLGWGANPQDLATRIERLHHGLSGEDEFSVVCSWLGKCSLVHKLDQNQAPPTSRDQYQVPDLMATFEVNGVSVPVLIEVKVKNSQTISFRPDYYQKLRNYADLLKLPLLVAWKYESLWTLVNIDHFSKATKNWNLSLNRALMENLLGVLAGDLSYSLYEGAGIHIRMRKDELIETTWHDDQSYTEQWKMTIEDAYFTDGNGNERRDFPSELQALFFSWPLTASEDHEKSHIVKSYVADEQQSLFAHMALVRLLHWQLPTTGGLNWRPLLGAREIVSGLGNFSEALKLALDNNVVRLVLHQHPRTTPHFI